ncbi:MAG: hypothetical protein JWP91_3125 [Fibrobacteres bacterium]|nr:hypothetical protein [Fibrobacterota bacterium]
MQTNALGKWVETNFERIAMVAAKGTYPFPFKASQTESAGYRIDAPIVNHQLVCSDRAQVLIFLIMDLASLAYIANTVFPKLPRNEGIQMAVSANNEILNITSSKLAAVLNQVEIAKKSIVTPPVVMSYSNEAAFTLDDQEALAFDFKCSGINFKFIATVQTI